MAKPKGAAKTGGRQRGTPNKLTAHLKEMILEAAEKAGGEGGTVAYLQTQALLNPGPFLALLGKVLPMQIAGDEDNPVSVITRIDLIGVQSTASNT